MQQYSDLVVYICLLAFLVSGYAIGWASGYKVGHNTGFRRGKSVGSAR